jgi:hypothetical protein
MDQTTIHMLTRLIVRTVLFAVLVSATQAQVTRFDTRAAYNAVVTGNTVIDFNGVPDPSGTMYPGGLTLCGTTFSGINGATAEILDATVMGVSGQGLLLFANNGQFNTDSLRIDLPANTFSFGIDFKGGGSFATEPYTFTLFSGAANLGTFVTTATSNSAYSFIGFSSLTDPITAVQIQVTGAIGVPEPVIDNVTFSSSVPEPSTWISIIVGSVILLAWRRSAILGNSAFVGRHTSAL